MGQVTPADAPGSLISTTNTCTHTGLLPCRLQCWGLVEEWFATDLIIAQAYNPWTHPDHGTVLRILTIEVPYTMAVEGDRTYGGMLGSLR